MSEQPDRLRALFAAHFGAPGAEAVCVRAPGRVNLIGEHTDYNGGFVLPMAIARAVWMLAQPRRDSTVRVFAANFEEEASFDLNDIRRDEQHRWLNYAQGVAKELLALGLSLRGLDAVIWGDVPIGAGLSSSAAIEVASALTLLQLSPQPSALSPQQIALLCQRAENRFVGVNCGIMDQMVSLLAQAGAALLLDCRDLSYEQVPLDMTEHCFAIVDSAKERALAASKYNERRAECEEAVRLLAPHLGDIETLRDVTPQQLARFEAVLPENVRKRAKHVVGEILRTQLAANALRRGDLRLFGRGMDDSHDSLKNLYEVSSRELDALVEVARSMDGVLGSRLTGAGFGGCTVTLLRKEALDDFLAQLPPRYEKATGRRAKVWVSEAASGAEVRGAERNDR